MHIKSRHIDWQSFEMDNSWCSKPITSATLFSRCHKRTTADLSPIDFTWQKTWNHLRLQNPGGFPQMWHQEPTHGETMDHLPSPFVKRPVFWLTSTLIPRFWANKSGEQTSVAHWCSSLFEKEKQLQPLIIYDLGWANVIETTTSSGKICGKERFGGQRCGKNTDWHRTLWENMLEEPPLDYIGITHPQSKCRKLLLAKLPSSSASGASTRNHSNVRKHNQFKSTSGPNFTKNPQYTHLSKQKNDPLKSDLPPHWNYITFSHLKMDGFPIGFSWNQGSNFRCYCMLVSGSVFPLGIF